MEGKCFELPIHKKHIKSDQVNSANLLFLESLRMIICKRLVASDDRLHFLLLLLLLSFRRFSNRKKGRDLQLEHIGESN